MEMLKNDKGLPYLNEKLMTAIFDCVYSLENVNASTRQLLQDSYFKDFMKVLKVNQEFNYFHRQSTCQNLFPIFENTVGPMERNSDGTTFWLALGLAIKELYGMRNATLAELLKKVNVRK